MLYTIRAQTTLCFTLVLASLALLTTGTRTSHIWAALPPQGPSFLGAWCPQGDPNKHASISNNGAFFQLTNERAGCR